MKLYQSTVKKERRLVHPVKKERRLVQLKPHHSLMKGSVLSKQDRIAACVTVATMLIAIRFVMNIVDPSYVFDYD